MVAPQNLKEREKKAVLRHTHSFFILWVAGGLARPATAAATVTATAAAIFIEWIDLAAPPVTKAETIPVSLFETQV